MSPDLPLLNVHGVRAGGGHRARLAQQGDVGMEDVILHILLPLWKHTTNRLAGNNNNNGNFYSALPIKNFTAKGAYKSDTNINNITHTHTH